MAFSRTASATNADAFPAASWSSSADTSSGKLNVRFTVIPQGYQSHTPAAKGGPNKHDRLLRSYTCSMNVHQWVGTSPHALMRDVEVTLEGGPYDGAQLVMQFPQGVPRSLEHVDGEHGHHSYYPPARWRFGEPMVLIWSRGYQD